MDGELWWVNDRIALGLPPCELPSPTRGEGKRECRATVTNLNRPHGEERRRRVSNHVAALSFETHRYAMLLRMRRREAAEYGSRVRR